MFFKQENKQLGMKRNLIRKFLELLKYLEKHVVGPMNLCSLWPICQLDHIFLYTSENEFVVPQTHPKNTRNELIIKIFHSSIC